MGHKLPSCSSSLEQRSKKMSPRQSHIELIHQKSAWISGPIFSLCMRKLLMCFFFLWLFQILSNFILLIHFSTDWCIDSHDLSNLNSWESQNSVKFAKFLQKLQKFCKVLSWFLLFFFLSFSPYFSPLLREFKIKSF